MQMYLGGFPLLLLQPHLGQKLRSEGFLLDRVTYPWAPLQSRFSDQEGLAPPFLSAVEVGANPPKGGLVIARDWGVGTYQADRDPREEPAASCHCCCHLQVGGFGGLGDAWRPVASWTTE